MTKIITDGNTACSKIAYALSDIACIYPITPSSTMAENFDTWSNEKKQNVFGNVPNVVEMQSEGGASGAVHGSLSAGALTTTFTASQGLLLMIPNMYKIAGEVLPTVFHVSSRALAGHALSIFGDHSDVMAVRSTGFCILNSCNVQECMDMALVSHIASLKASLPFVHFFDGFRTSHEIQKIDDVSLDDIRKILPNEKIEEFRNRALSPLHPHSQGTAQNADVYFQNKEASNTLYNNVVGIVEDTFKEINSITNRQYNLFDYYGDKNATSMIIAMGSGIETIRTTINQLNATGGHYGVIAVRLFRPFSPKHLLDAVPSTCKNIAVLDRTKESTAIYEPLCEDVITSLHGKNIKIIGGRYGLGSKEFTPSMVKAVFDNLNEDNSIDHFTIGINDDVTFKSLNYENGFILNDNWTACKFYGLGSDGTVGANKNSIKIIGELTDLHTQGYFEYDSKKSGSLTVSHLRFGSEEIRAPYLVKSASFVACHNKSFITKYDMLETLNKDGIFLLNSNLTQEELDSTLPLSFKKQIIDKNIKFYNIDAFKIASACSLNGKINTVMQICFFKLINLKSYDEVEKLIKKYIKKSYMKKGEDIVLNNYNAIDQSITELKRIQLTLKDTKEPINFKIDNDFYNNIMKPINTKNGDSIPVSAFSVDGHTPTDTTKYEKRGIAEKLPSWDKTKCIQCNRCSLVCPHAAISPKLVKKENLSNAPESFETIAAKGEDFEFRIQVDALDCTGCSNCASVCPTHALTMKDSKEILDKEVINYNYSLSLPEEKSKFSKDTVKGSQFLKNYFQFSGACAGCGEASYIRLITQLYGENMIIANATGCSSIYGGSFPSCPYAKDKNGNGPAWANSLFEDNAEFGLGIHLAYKKRRENLKNYITNNLNDYFGVVKDILSLWLENFNNEAITKELYRKLKLIFEEKTQLSNVEEHLQKEFDCFIKKFIWIIGGDGWAYDIGYGGLDHVMSLGEDVRILVLDTEVYSNTGGQSSKSTPMGAVAKFASGGKKTKKKDLGKIAMGYKNIYVGQVSMGANPNQLIKTITEAQNYNGTSLIIAYSPCINHGIDMTKSQLEMKRAVDSGYWFLYRYNPDKEQKFTLDSKKPTMEYTDFLLGERRYTSLLSTDKEKAEELFNEAQKESKEKYKEYLDLANK